MNISDVSYLPAPTPDQYGFGSKSLAAAQAASVPTAVVPTSVLFASVEGNLTQQAASVFQVLRAGTTYPASSNPSYVLPVDGFGLSRLFSTLQAIAVERVYPAPIFSFQA
jgi:hypothetical protein